MPVLPDVIARGYRKRMQGHIAELRKCAGANHVDYEFITTEQPLDLALFSFLSRRTQR
jgi:hypothetical protein